MDRLGEKIVQFIKKYRYVALVLLIGMFLMILPEKKEAAVQTEETRAVQANEPDTAEELSQILSQIQGAGKVQVMLTEATGSQTVYQTNDDISSGGESSNSRRTTVTVTDENRTETGLIQQVNPPAYLGAIVVCQGADSASVRLAIVEAVSDVTGLGADRISVLKMK